MPSAVYAVEVWSSASIMIFRFLPQAMKRISDNITVEFLKCLFNKHLCVYNVNKIIRCSQACGGNCQ